ncbi:MAG: hypothetical protein ACRECX_12625 [Methyloceanibacter sp.]|uniref:hypothetical protein n=1 Tax=Methyloceanibacter sp. TaxID=1965321 RepID=UPI003D6CBE21
MSKTTSRVSAARRNAETILNQGQKRQESFKLEQKLAHDAMMQKTARLRELRLAKEAADREAAASAPVTPKTRKPRRSKQT